MESFVNIVTTLPFFAIMYTVQDPYSIWRFFVRMLDLMRLQILFRITSYVENELTRELIKIITGCKCSLPFIYLALALIICFTGYIQWLENMKCMFIQDQCIDPDASSEQHFVNFFDSFFIMMTTVSVIGYVSPVISEAGKVSMIVIMIIIVAVIPNQSSKLVSLISTKSIYARKKYKSIDKVPHIVILGSVSSIALFNFLDEYLHEDHGNYNRHCVLM